MSYKGDVPVRDQLGMFRKMTEQRWPVSPAGKEMAISTLMEFIQDENLPAKQRMTAIDLYQKIAAQQFNQDVAAITVEMRYEDHQRLAAYEDNHNSDFSSIPEIEVVSDAPVHAALEDHSEGSGH